MEEILALDITPLEESTYDISATWDNLREQILLLYNKMKSEARKSLLVLLLSCTMGNAQTVAATIENTVDCTEIVESGIADKYYSKLDEMALLEDDWDGEGAKAVNIQALENGRRLIEDLPASVLSAGLRLFPSELGAVSLKLVSPKGTLRAEIGDEIFSYYLKKKESKKATHHSFEPWTEGNISIFVSSLESLV